MGQTEDVGSRIRTPRSLGASEPRSLLTRPSCHVDACPLRPLLVCFSSATALWSGPRKMTKPEDDWSRAKKLFGCMTHKMYFSSMTPSSFSFSHPSVKCGSALSVFYDNLLLPGVLIYLFFDISLDFFFFFLAERSDTQSSYT